MRTMLSTEGSVVQPGSKATAGGTPDALLSGTKAGPWIVGERLGRGGMGTVYAVTHEEIGKRAALKVMHDFLATGITAERIKLEARVVNRVGHPNIVDIFETGALEDGRPYIVMERLDGVCLGNLAFETKVLPDRVVEILIQISDALIAAHAAGVIHRDLKLDNVFLLPIEDGERYERVKLLDWGIAKEIATDVHHTIDGQLVGTPQYLSPEQARGAVLTPATDVYSLGVMAFELFLEQLPFEAETAAEVMVMHLRQAPPQPSELWPDIPHDLEHLLLAMLAKRAEDRPSLETVAGTLLRVREELDRRRVEPAPPVPKRHTRFASAPPLGPLRRTPTRRWHVALGAAALVASASLFFLARDSRSLAAAPLPASLAEPATAITAPAITQPHVDTPVQAAVQAAPVVQAMPAPIAAKPDPARGVHKHSHHAGGSTQAHPRTAAFDPDGSVDPY
jgi:tRNA A-37 threonylcarbamoyl transferase component Bud32